jgi:hypothetical protein
VNQEASLGKSGSCFTVPLHFLSRRLDDEQAKYINMNLFLIVHYDALSLAAVINIAYHYLNANFGKI